MESKILIDIRPTGEPFLYIDFKSTDDLRDKVLSRFLYDSGAADLAPDGTPKNPTKLDLHILWSDDKSGRVQAMIEHSTPIEKSLPLNADQIHLAALKKVDEWSIQNLSPDQYKRWRKDVFGQSNFLKNLPKAD